ncbi:MAG: AAA family ATPase [Pseudomonadota bacterium]
MGNIIAIAGKGGTGKTTIAGFLVRYLVEKSIIPVLAVDADPNANLNEVLGIEISATIGEAREGLKKEVPAGMSRDTYMEYKIQQSVVEEKGFDFIVMGRPEGPGCYCHANTLLSKHIGILAENYKAIVMDNEAGMEHISRLVAKNPDILLLVSDPTFRGIQAAQRLFHLSKEIALNAKKTWLIVNRVRKGISIAVEQAITESGIELAGYIPEDEEIIERDSERRPTSLISQNSKAVCAMRGIFDKILMAL